MKLQDFNHHPRLKDKDEYEDRLAAAQRRLLALQQSIYRERRRAIVAFEGWDAAGKGGSIRRLTERLDPRGFSVWAIGRPREDEQGRHYLWRFWQRLPVPGEIAVFDRTWYGRVLVERVEGLASKPEWRRAFDEINDFERLLVADGIPVVKIFLHITKGEQLRRFRERRRNPWKHWKIGPEDWRNRRRRKDYHRAIDEMLKRTDTKAAPWTVIAANAKWYARTEALRTVADALEEAW